MYENINELIDKNLKLIYESGGKNFNIYDFLDEKNKLLYYEDSNIDLDTFVQYLSNKNLIEIRGEFSFITEFGNSVSKFGGWKAWIEQEQEADLLREKIQADKETFKYRKELAEIQNNEWSAKVSKFLYKTRGLPLLFTFAGLVISLISLYHATKLPKEVQSEEKLSKFEILHIIDSISTSNQTKKVDSSHIAKTPVDSVPTPKN